MTLFFSKFASHQSKHQTTSKMGCQPSGCRWPLLIFPTGLCGYVWLTYYTITPRVLDGYSSRPIYRRKTGGKNLYRTNKTHAAHFDQNELCKLNGNINCPLYLRIRCVFLLLPPEKIWVELE